MLKCVAAMSRLPPDGGFLKYAMPHEQPAALSFASPTDVGRIFDVSISRLGSGSENGNTLSLSICQINQEVAE